MERSQKSGGSLLNTYRMYRAKNPEKKGRHCYQGTPRQQWIRAQSQERGPGPVGFGEGRRIMLSQAIVPEPGSAGKDKGDSVGK